MANPTTNYSFAMPTNTDLVKDLPADFDIFGQAVDDRIKALNPETTAGDIAYRASTANAKSRLAIGTAGQVLTVNSGATAPEWATLPASGGMTSIASGSLSGSSVALTSIAGTYKDLKLYVNDVNCSNNGSNVRITVNSLADYDRVLVNSDTTSTVFDAAYAASVYQFQASPYKNGDYNNAFNMTFHDYADTNANKIITSDSFSFNVADKKELDIGLCAAKTTSAITSITISVSAGTFTGSYKLFGVN